MSDERSRRAVADDAAGQSEDRRERILAVATRLFATRGFDNVSVRDVAEEAGVTHPLIYYHWGSKQELLAAVVEDTQEKIRASFARAEAAHPGNYAAAVHESLRAVIIDSLASGRPYYLTAVRAYLDGMPIGDWPGGNPGAEAVLRLLLASGPPGDPDWAVEARITAALVTAIVTGWVLLEEQVLSIVDLPGEELERARSRVLTTVDAVVRRALDAHAEASTGGRTAS